MARYASVWFRHLMCDWMRRRQPDLRGLPFVLAAPERGRMVVKASSAEAELLGILEGMVVADCRAILPTLQVLDDVPYQAGKLLHALAEWCIRFTPVASVDPPCGLMLDFSGCTHLWGSEWAYIKDLGSRLEMFGYKVQIAIADTIGAAWALARYAGPMFIAEPGRHTEALMGLPPSSLRIEPQAAERLTKLGLHTVRSFVNMPRPALRKRFGQGFVQRVGQAMGSELEMLEPVVPVEPYQERLPCLEPIRTAEGIAIAIRRLLEALCTRLEKEEMGLRTAVLKCYRVDGNVQEADIGTNRPSRKIAHLCRLFEHKIASIEPALGIELFLMEAPLVEPLPAEQDVLWNTSGSGNQAVLAELLDTLAGRVGMHTIHRYLPAEHYWPERSLKAATSLAEVATTQWREGIPRPVTLLNEPEPIEVMVRLPDYPPIHFRYNNQVHLIKKADGPERIEQEWWLQQDLYRDYYCVEDEAGSRYWLFRAGHYEGGTAQWFLHGFFA